MSAHLLVPPVQDGASGSAGCKQTGALENCQILRRCRLRETLQLKTSCRHATLNVCRSQPKVLLRMFQPFEEIESTRVCQCLQSFMDIKLRFHKRTAG